MTCEKTNMRGSSAPPAQGCIFSIEKPASYWARTTTKATQMETEPQPLWFLRLKPPSRVDDERLRPHQISFENHVRKFCGYAVFCLTRT